VFGLAFWKRHTARSSLLLTDSARIEAVGPKYEAATLLALLGKMAALLHIETDASWTTFRRILLDTLNIKSMISLLVGSISSILATTLLVMLYTLFFMMEIGRFSA
jgi:hypothetical protein